MDTTDLKNELERPLNKNNISIVGIFQILIIFYITYESCKNFFGIIKFSHFSIIDLIKLVIDAIIVCGFLIGIYGFFSENSDYLKKGFLFFACGCLGILCIFILDWIKGGFDFGSFIKFLFYGFIAYILYIQSKHL